VSGPFAEIVGAAGGVGSFNPCESVPDTHPLPSAKVIVYDPAVSPEIVTGSATPVILPEAVPDQLKLPLPDPEICMLPVDVPQAVGFVTVPIVIIGAVFTVTVVPTEVAEHVPFDTVTE
jgi:hypothetical protein